MKTYRADLDILKGLSIIAVVLYHVGILPYGYLGVDTFLLINGFLIIPPIVEKIGNGSFDYIDWLKKRIYRFWPLVIIASLVCMVLGYFTMIPFDYENLGQSVVASDLFANNILSAITTADYWNSANEYKPLMHMWYLGIIVQFYVVVPLLLVIFHKCARKSGKNGMVAVLAGITSISFILYLLPSFSFNDKFYFLPFRIWEIGLGGLIGIILSRQRLQLNYYISLPTLALLLLCFVLNAKTFAQINTITIVGQSSVQATPLIPQNIVLLITCLLSAILLLPKKGWTGNPMVNWIIGAGRMSLSIYVWHQIILAFLRYSVIDQMTVGVFALFVIATVGISYLTYKYIEPIKIDSKGKNCVMFASLAIVTGCGLLIHLRAGVFKDFPEMGIYANDPFQNRNTEYIDRIYKYDRPFDASQKIKVLVVGNSFARDFASILLEWDVEQRLDLSYQYCLADSSDPRFAQCDYIFYFGPKHEIPDEIWNKLSDDCKVYGIGTKIFGKNFGRIYAKHFSKDYLNQAIPEHSKCREINDQWRSEWGESRFVDLMKEAKRSDGLVRLFTPEGKVMSFDCQHLTRYACQFYAQQIDFYKIFNVEQI